AGAGAPVKDGDAEEAQTRHGKAGDGAALEGDVQGGGQTVLGGLGGADVGAHGDVHADVPGDGRADGADEEADGGGRPEGDEDDHRQDDGEDRHRLVLAVQVGHGAFLN